MDVVNAVVGTQNHVSPGQECARAVLIFAYGLFLMRHSGRRTFGKWSALDVIVSVIVGSTFSRALTGNGNGRTDACTLACRTRGCAKRRAGPSARRFADSAFDRWQR